MADFGQEFKIECSLQMKGQAKYLYFLKFNKYETNIKYFLSLLKRFDALTAIFISNGLQIFI